MTPDQEMPPVVSASRDVAAEPGRIFELIADLLSSRAGTATTTWPGHRPGSARAAKGDVFTMMLARGSIRENHVTEFEEGRRIAWMPAEPGQQRPGHLWRWELEPAGPSSNRVTCTYYWTQLSDENRLPRAWPTTADRLRASLDRLAALAEGS